MSDNPSSSDPNESNNQIESDDQDEMTLPDRSPLPELYKVCETILSQYVNDKGEVNYSLLRRKRSDLNNAMSYLKNVHPAQIMALNDNEKQAFWINTYNLCTLKLIIDNYPIQPKWYMILYPNNSVMQISDPWTKNYFEIQGLQYNLREIEQELLLLRFKDPRICFALSNATRGGAALRKEPYRAEILSDQLDDQVKQFLASAQGITMEMNTNTAYISNLFNIHRDTFLKSKYAEIKKFRQRKPDEKAWLNFLLFFIKDTDKSFFENHDIILKFKKFDWELNEFSGSQ
ncbi:MAG: DUF547 domain-containing protein [Sedimentisphaerales bacterium]|nr:DUF547 domain-containing protein [Sedimentisphaerales bacterium]